MDNLKQQLDIDNNKALAVCALQKKSNIDFELKTIQYSVKKPIHQTKNSRKHSQTSYDRPTVDPTFATHKILPHWLTDFASYHTYYGMAGVDYVKGGGNYQCPNTVAIISG